MLSANGGTDLRILSGLVASLLLGGCIMQVDTATISVRDDGRADIDLSSGPTAILSLGADESSSTDMFRSLSPEERAASDRRVAEMRECLGGNLTYDEGNLTARLSVRDQTSSQIAMKLRCIEDLDKVADLSITRERGWLQDSLVARVGLWLPIQRGADGNGALIAPRQLTIQFENGVSGDVAYATTGVNPRFEQPDDDTIRVYFDYDTTAMRRFYDEQDRSAECPGKSGDTCPVREPYYAKVDLAFSSSQNKFTLGDVLTFFSILFGSGLAVTVGSRLLAVRTESKPSRK